MYDLRPKRPWETEEVAMFRDSVRRFLATEAVPRDDHWRKQKFVDRDFWHKAGALGMLCPSMPEEYGGSGGSFALEAVISEELSYVSMTSFMQNVHGGIVAPYLGHYGTDAQKKRWLPKMCSGEFIGAIAMTEPGCGSDLQAIRTTARRDGDDYVVNGSKMFITSGMRADYITVAVRTGEAGSKGSGGISMILVPTDVAGLSRIRLEKMGWWCSDTAHLRFDKVRVPATNLLGEEGGGFKIIMTNFNGERLSMSAMALGFAQACFDEALDWARQRKTFGNSLMEHQVIRHKLVDMQMRISSTQAWLDAITARADAGDLGADWVAQVCMLKNHATQTMQFCADQAVQILGAMGFMRGTKSERIYREVKVMMIGGGAEEIMKELAARQLGL